MAASEVTVAWITAGATLAGALAGAAAMRFGALATVRAAVVGQPWQRMAPMVPTVVPPWCLLADNAPRLLVMPSVPGWARSADLRIATGDWAGRSGGRGRSTLSDARTGAGS